MHIGLLTKTFGKDAKFKDIVKWTSKAGFKALEISRFHLQPKDVLPDDGRKVKQLLSDYGLRVSGLEYYLGFNTGEGPAAYLRAMKELILMAAILKVDAICTFIGLPSPGKTRMQTIREEAPAVFNPLAEEAKKHDVRIAFENWYATNLLNLDHFKAVTEVLPQDNIGFNFDPSHLAWQEIDYLAAVDEFKDRIFHTHAKDVAVFNTKRSRLGVLEKGWWEYVIPGYGIISWGEYIRTLRLNGYDGVLSIEHEDKAFNAQEGFEKGIGFLSRYI